MTPFTHTTSVRHIACKAIATLWICCFNIAVAASISEQLQEGDVLFTSSDAGQALAIRAATGSSHTHVGIAVVHQGRLMVLEAVQPVRITTLERFIAGGTPGSLTARRYSGEIDAAAYQKARQWAISQVGRNYDNLFAWSDDRMYCSELVWKIYQKSGVRLCEPRKFRDYNLSHPEVRKLIDKRYGGMDRLPLDELVVAPSDLAASPLLVDLPLVTPADE